MVDRVSLKADSIPCGAIVFFFVCATFGPLGFDMYTFHVFKTRFKNEVRSLLQKSDTFESGQMGLN